MLARDPIAMFMKEHELALEQLHILKKVSQEIKKKGFSDKSIQQLVKAAEYINEEVTEHNAKEEKILLPIIDQHYDGPSANIRDDHRKMAKLNKKLRISLNSFLENNNDKVAKSELCEAAEEIVQLMVNHIHKENQIIFPMIKKILPKDQLRELVKKMI